MKKCFALLLASMLLLSACASYDADETQPVSTTVETVPQGYYLENSQPELDTAGAVRKYTLPQATYAWVKAVDSGIVLASEQLGLQLLSGEEGIPSPFLPLEKEQLKTLQQLTNGFAYYDEANKQAVYLDGQLRQTRTVDMPADIEGMPLFSPNANQIYYCADKQIRALDVLQGLSRRLKSHEVAQQELVRLHFDGSVLECRVTTDSGAVNTLYISTENGQTQSVDNSIEQLDTYENSYLLSRMDGVVRQRIVGLQETEPKQVNIPDPHMVDTMALGCVLGYAVDAAGVLQLNLYDLSSGLKRASVSLTGFSAPLAVSAEKATGCIWLLLEDQSAQPCLLRWLPATDAQDTQVYVGQLFTSEQPDQTGLKAFEQRVSDLNSKYGVRIRLWQDAVKITGGHTLIAEYQTAAISDMLDALEPVLAEFPKRFLTKSVSTKVRICLVRSVDGQTAGVQFWDDNYAYVALPAGCDIRSEFMKNFAFVIDSHILGNSPKFDYWPTLNPQDFVYGGTADAALAQGQDRAFVDTDSMMSVITDRSRVFWQAMQPDNGQMFQSETLQKKLTMLCKAIREAWGLEYKTEVYPWEQYLTESIAYKE